MKLNEDKEPAVVVSADIYNDTSSASGNTLMDNRISIQKIIVKNVPEPAPFYDELHFANYE